MRKAEAGESHAKARAPPSGVLSLWSCGNNRTRERVRFALLRRVRESECREEERVALRELFLEGKVICFDGQVNVGESWGGKCGMILIHKSKYHKCVCVCGSFREREYKTELIL